MPEATRSECIVGDGANYLVGAVLTNAFAFGHVGESDDFWMVAAPMDPANPFPLMTANIIDERGELLCRIVRNVPVVNPRGCAVVRHSHGGFELCRADGGTVFSFAATPDRAGTRTYSLSGEFFDRQKKPAVRADADGGSEFNAPHVLGWSKPGRFGRSDGFDRRALEIARHMFASGGAIHERVTGRLERQFIEMDGKFFENATLVECRLRVSEGNFVALGNVVFRHCSFRFSGPAERLRALVRSLEPQEPQQPATAISCQ